MTIAVTGGNGEFGHAVLQTLHTRTSDPVVATVRDLTKTQPLPSVEHRPGNFDDPDTLQASLAGVDTVLINATFFGDDPTLRLPRTTAAIRAATRAGVGRIVLTSWPDLDHATLPTIQDYHELEALVKTAGPAWTILRLGPALATATARDVVWAKACGELVAPAAAAQVTPAALTDLAEATAAVLTQPGHEHLVHELTGPDALTWDDLATLAGVPYHPVDDDEYRTHLSHRNLPPAMVQQLIEMYRDFRSPWASTPTPTLANLTGRAPTPGIQAVSQRVAQFPIA